MKTSLKDTVGMKQKLCSNLVSQISIYRLNLGPTDTHRKGLQLKNKEGTKRDR